MATELGRITIVDDEGNHVVFTLTTKGWTCSDNSLQAIVNTFNATYSMRNYSVADGQPGAGLLQQAATWLKGWPAYTQVQVQMLPPQQLPPGTIY